MEQEIFICTDQGRIDLGFIHQYLSGKSYWGQGRRKEHVKKSLRHSLYFGLFSGNQQIGYGRVVSDYKVFAWIMDLFVDPVYRGRGLGRMLIQTILIIPSCRGSMVLVRVPKMRMHYMKNSISNPYLILKHGCFEKKFR